MASIERRTKGRTTQFVVRWREPGGGSRQRTFDTQRDARAFRRTIDGDLAADRYVDPSRTKVLLGEWIEDWAANRVGVRPTTEARNESVIKNHILPSFGDRAIGDLRQRDVQRWVRGLVDAGLAPATVRVCYQVLSAALDAAVDAEQLRVSPCRAIDLPKVRTEEKRFLDHEQVLTLANAMPDRYRTLVLVLAFAGLRIGEAAALRRTNLSLTPDGASIRVAMTAVEVRGKWGLQPPKTSASRRTVPIARNVAEALRRHLDQFVARGPDALVFTAPAGGPLRVATFRRRVWVPATNVAGLDGLDIHELRHSAVALWISAGADPLRIQRWAGHSSSRVTLDVYGHLFETDDVPVLASLDAAIDLAALGGPES